MLEEFLYDKFMKYSKPLFNLMKFLLNHFISFQQKDLQCKFSGFTNVNTIVDSTYHHNITFKNKQILIPNTLLKCIQMTYIKTD